MQRVLTADTALENSWMFWDGGTAALGSLVDSHQVSFMTKTSAIPVYRCHASDAIIHFCYLMVDPLYL